MPSAEPFFRAGEASFEARRLPAEADGSFGPTSELKCTRLSCLLPVGAALALPDAAVLSFVAAGVRRKLKEFRKHDCVTAVKPASEEGTLEAK